jgi:hypothetical protein
VLAGQLFAIDLEQRVGETLGKHCPERSHGFFGQQRRGLGKRLVAYEREKNVFVGSVASTVVEPTTTNGSAVSDGEALQWPLRLTSSPCRSRSSSKTGAPLGWWRWAVSLTSEESTR